MGDRLTMIFAALTAIGSLAAAFQLSQLRMEVRELSLITKDEVLGLTRIVRRLLNTDAANKAEIEALKAEVAAIAFVNDPELNAEIEGLIQEAGDATPGTPEEETQPVPAPPPSE